MRYESGGRSPAEDTARLPVDDRCLGATHATQEQIEHATEIAVGVISAGTPAQVAVQRYEIEQKLQRIMSLEQRLGQGGRPVMPGGQWSISAAEPIRLVVDDEVHRP